MTEPLDLDRIKRDWADFGEIGRYDQEALIQEVERLYVVERRADLYRRTLEKIEAGEKLPAAWASHALWGAGSV